MTVKVYEKDKLLFVRLKGLPREALLQTPIQTVPFCARALNAFERMGLKTVGDLAKLTRFELLKVRNLGRTSLKQIEVYLEALGLALGWREFVDDHAVLLQQEREKNERLAALLLRSKALITELQEAVR